MYRPTPRIAATISTQARSFLIASLTACLLASIAPASTTPPPNPPGEPIHLAPMDETDELAGSTGSLAPMDETEELAGNTNSLAPMDETDELAPMDETDELAGNTGFLAPMDETDELAGGVSHRWFEVVGHGLLEIAQTPNGDLLQHHPWCPWSEARVSSNECARQLRVESSRRILLRPASAASSEVVGLEVTSVGSLLIETMEDALSPDATSLSGTIFDGAGNQLGEVRDGESVSLEAGHVYLRIGSWPRSAAVALDIMLD